jgi:hypothetical protein
MRKNLMSTAAMAAMMIPAAWAQSAAPAQPVADGVAKTKTTIHERKDNQQQRIGEGVENGSLTAAEAGRLEKKEAAINKETHLMKKDGDFTAAERAKVQRQQSAVSTQIYNQKHDAQHQSAGRGEVETRDRAQQKRVGEGIENGSLTAGEAAKLESKNAKLQQEEHKLRAKNGGTLDAHDKAKVNRQQNRMSKNIYSQKHDAQRRRK